MYARISSPLKHFSIHIFPHATHPVSKEVSLKGRRWDYGEQTFLRPIIIWRDDQKLQKQLQRRGYPESLIQNILSEVNFEDRKLALQEKRTENKRILTFVTQYQPSVPNLKQIIMNKWHLINKQP